MSLFQASQHRATISSYDLKTRLDSQLSRMNYQMFSTGFDSGDLGGQTALHARAFHGRPYDGHTLGSVITETQALTGVEIKRAYVDKGYVGHNAPKPLRVYRSGQKRGVHGQIKRELRRRAAIEPVIGHLKSEGHLDRNYLKGRHGDQTNAILTATGHNLRLVLRWLMKLVCKFITALIAAIAPVSELRTAS